MTRRKAMRPNHDRLLRKLDWRPDTPPSGGPVDAIIVPAARRAHHLKGLVTLASRCGATLVVLASHQCDVDEAAELVAKTPGSGRAVLVSVPFGEIPVAEAPSGDEFDILRLDTSADHFRKLNGHRTSNLSLKRNLGLLLARYRGWRKIMFLDDDIIGVTQEHVARVAHHLDSNRFAGLRTLRFEDNSVVCHANRLAGKPQGIFVSGAGVGVNTADGVDIEVFPEAYNEDWFAFAADAADAGVAHVGDVGQLEYNPFEDPRRAAFEEFGDLIAEGLFALFNDGCGLHRATELYWERFIDERRRFIEEVRLRLLRVETHERVQATRSLWEARLRLDAIGPNDCKAFLEAWQEDRSRFARAGRRASRHCYEYGDAFAALGVKQWQEACFGVVSMPTLASVSSSRTRR